MMFTGRIKIKKADRRISKKIGGKKIGEGAYGAVYSPPLYCENGSEKDFLSENFVSKILSVKAANIELANSKIIRSMDPEGRWSITAENWCHLKIEQTNANFMKNKATRKNLYDKKNGSDLVQIIFKNGGQTIMSLLEKSDVNNTDDYEWSNLPLIIQISKNLITVLSSLNQTHVHGDLHFKNIVWNGSEAHIIDFGLMENIHDMKSDTTHELWHCLRHSSEHNNKKFIKILKTLTKDTTVIKEISLLLDDKLANPEDIKEVTKPIIRDAFRRIDVERLFINLRNIFENEGCKTAFPGIYDYFLFTQPMTYEDYVNLILRIPIVEPTRKNEERHEFTNYYYT